jgi:hypothetical protein
VTRPAWRFVTVSGFVARCWEEATQVSTSRLRVNLGIGRESQQFADKGSWSGTPTCSRPSAPPLQTVSATPGGRRSFAHPSMTRSSPSRATPRADLTLKTDNGGITISDVRGQIHFDGNNGGVHLKRLAGDVTGAIVNGGVQVELAGTIWDGRQLEVSTRNGGISVAMPSYYSAHIQAETQSGGVQSDFPVMLDGNVRPRQLDFNLGSGGPLIHITTTNGRVSLKRAESQEAEPSATDPIVEFAPSCPWPRGSCPHCASSADSRTSRILRRVHGNHPGTGSEHSIFRPELFRTARASGSMPSRPVARCRPANPEGTSHARLQCTLRSPRAGSP